MTKKLLYQFDTDPLPAVFDNVVAYDGGADHITAYGGVTAANVGGLVEGAIFTRGPKDKKNTALFIGGGNMTAGQALLGAVQAKFFGKFRVSVMFDCNGSNTTAAAAVAWLAHGRLLRGKHAVVLAGTGPVGQRAAALLSSEGATVTITGRKLDAVQTATASIKSRFGIDVQARAAATNEERAVAIAGAHIVLATGAAGITLLNRASGRSIPPWNWWRMRMHRHLPASRGWPWPIAAPRATARYCSARWGSERSSSRCTGPALPGCSIRTT